MGGNRRRPALIAAVAALVAAAGTVGALLLTSSSGTTIAMPERLLGMDRVNSSHSTSLSIVMKAMPFKGPSKIGFYAGAGGQVRAFLYVNKSSRAEAAIAPALTQLTAGFREAVPQATFAETAAGPLGGRMECALYVASGTHLTSCFFIDRDAIGSLTFADGFIAGASPLAFRQAMEKRG